MTPRGIIFTELGLPVPQQNDINTWLFVDGMAGHGSLRMINALKAENGNLRGGVRAGQETIEELAEQLETATKIATQYATAISDYYAQNEHYRAALLAVLGTDNYEDAVQAAQQGLEPS